MKSCSRPKSPSSFVRLSFQPLLKNRIQRLAGCLFHDVLELRVGGGAAAIALEIRAQAVVKIFVTHGGAQLADQECAFLVNGTAEELAGRGIPQRKGLQPARDG